MGHLAGLKEYLDASYARSTFEQLLASQEVWTFHLHGQRVVTARLTDVQTYDLKMDIVDREETEVPKLQVKFFYLSEHAEALRKLIKTDQKVRDQQLGPIQSLKERRFVKNKTLFPFMQEKEVVFFTLLEGEIIRGLITDFSKYEIIVSLRGGIPVILLRHGIYDLRNKRDRCLLKSFQAQRRDWQKSTLFVC